MRVAETRASRMCALLALCLLVGSAAAAGPREQARRLHDRLAGVPPSAAVLDSMAALIGTGNPDDALAAAGLAMQNPPVLHDLAQELRDALDERRAHGSRGSERLQRHRDRDDPRQRAFRSSPHGRPRVRGRQRARPPTRRPTTTTTSALESQRVDLSNPALFVPMAQSALPGSQLQAGGRRRRDHHTRRGRGLLQRRHEPAHVALHRHQLPVPRHGAAARHHAAGGPHPPGRDAQPGRRQPAVPQRLHRLPQRHGRRRGRLRLLRVGRRTDARRAHARHGAAEVPDQLGQLPLRLRHRRTTAGTTTGGRARTRISIGAARPRAATAPRASARRSPRAAPSPSARSRRPSRTSASVRPTRTPMRPRSSASPTCSRRTGAR